MRKKKMAKHARRLRLRDKLARILKFSWIRFEEPLRRPEGEDKEEETSKFWFRMF